MAIRCETFGSAEKSHPEIVRNIYKLATVEMTVRLAAMAAKLALVDIATTPELPIYPAMPQC